MADFAATMTPADAKKLKGVLIAILVFVVIVFILSVTHYHAAVSPNGNGVQCRVDWTAPAPA